MQSKPILMIDVDGVLADFVSPIVKHANWLTAEELTPDQITQWDIQAMYPELPADDLYAPCMKKGFCEGLEEYRGAGDALQELRQHFTVVACTTPFWRSPYWHYERTQWLMRRGFQSNQIIFTADKGLVRGAALIDDKVDNVLDWERSNRPGLPILWKQPWSGTLPSPAHGSTVQAGSWEALMHVLNIRG